MHEMREQKTIVVIDGKLFTISIVHLYSGNPQTGTFANSEDPNAAFHQGLHFCKGKKYLPSNEYNIYLIFIT